MKGVLGTLKTDERVEGACGVRDGRAKVVVVVAGVIVRVVGGSGSFGDEARAE